MARRRRTARRLQLLIAGGCLTVAVGYPAAGFAADDPPPLPSGQNGCVAASPAQYRGIPWAVARMAPYLAWPLTRGVGVTVAVLGTGVAADAPGLRGAVKPGRDVAANPAAAPASNTDCLGSGTALAGVVAGREMSGTGVVGMAPGASVLPIRITDENGRVPAHALPQGIRVATQLGADVILVGTGTTVDSADLRAAVLDAASRDIVLVAPINDQSSQTPGVPSTFYPAAYKDVTAVGGFDTEGRTHASPPPAAGLDLLAPAAGAVVPGPAGGHYQVGGLAVAAAYVAGTAALVRSYHPTLGQAQVRRRLELTAERPAATTRAAGAAAGTIDPYAAVADIDPERGARHVAAPHEPVVLPAPPPPDPAVLRAALAATALAVATLAVLATGAVVRARRRRPLVRPPASTPGSPNPPDAESRSPASPTAESAIPGQPGAAGPTRDRHPAG